MSEKHENNVPVAEQPKKAWHAPVIDETSYAQTEAGGGPGPNYDGFGFYSMP
jgi:hypothetical protein